MSERLDDEDIGYYSGKDGEELSVVKHEMATEILERRAADLTADDRDLLETLRNCVEHHPCISGAYWRSGALAVLAKLIRVKP